MRRTLAVLFVGLLVWYVPGAAWNGQPPKPKEEPPPVVRDQIKGSIHHPGGFVGDRIRGKVKVIDARTLEFADGTRVLLTRVTPDLAQLGRIDGQFYPCGREAVDFLRGLIGDNPVMAFCEGGNQLWDVYIGDTNLEQAMVSNGWALAHHSSLHPAEVIAREHKRGMWRGEFVSPAEWRKGERLPGEDAARKELEEKKPDDKPPAILGTWSATAWHTVHASLFQSEHGARSRVTTVRFEQVGDRLLGNAIGGEDQEKAMPIPTVRFADDRLTLEFGIVWDRIAAAPLAVQAKRQPDKGTVRVEARLTGDRLVGQWKIFTADGAEVFRGEWSAVRSKEPEKR
jgi:endonuclease YncB( thermonuclease family)